MAVPATNPNAKGRTKLVQWLIWFVTAPVKTVLCSQRGSSSTTAQLGARSLREFQVCNRLNSI